MSDWIPTNYLRLVERDYGNTEETYRVRILQQKWEYHDDDGYVPKFMDEWRDVPVVEEE